jgi:putative hydrolase of the HAD superfamily
MSIRAVIFDIYKTILEIDGPPADAEVLWQRLFAEMLGGQPPVSRAEFAIRTSQVIAREHAAARARGIQWPEIQWPSVVLEVIPGLVGLNALRLEDFLLRQMQIDRPLRLADGAAECLRKLNSDGILLGIASNSQAYTLRELEAALKGDGLNLSIFQNDLRFWSFENGFSKPDPHAFRILAARLEARGISPSEILMIGDRLDNDIEPARAFGWQTWQLAAGKPGVQAGSWGDLRAWLGFV